MLVLFSIFVFGFKIVKKKMPFFLGQVKIISSSSKQAIAELGANTDKTILAAIFSEFFSGRYFLFDAN